MGATSGFLRIFPVLLTALHLSVCQAQSVDSLAATRDSLYSFLSSKAKAFKLNGSVLVTCQGRVLLDTAYGWRNIKKRVPHDTSSLFQIGSITKQFTAALILKLQAAGKISLTDSLAAFFPDYPGGKKIRICHLLAHTSGIYDYMDDFRPYDFILSKTRSKEEVVRMFRDKPLAFNPGEAYRYSNSGYFLLGMIIEKILKKPYEEVVRDSLLIPLGMAHTGFDFRNLSDPARSTGYSLFWPERQSVAMDMDSSITYAAGGIYSTSGDMGRWLTAFFDGRVLDSASLEAALTPGKERYGFGWRIDSLYGEKMFTHGGNTADFNAYVVHFPDPDISIIILQNFDGDAWPVCVGISRILFHEANPWGNQPVASVDSTAMQRFAGTYAYDEGNEIFIHCDGGHLSMYGSPHLRVYIHNLVPIGESSFYLSAYALRLEFVADATGKISKVILIKGGTVHECPRTE